MQEGPKHSTSHSVLVLWRDRMGADRISARQDGQKIKSRWAQAGCGQGQAGWEQDGLGTGRMWPGQKTKWGQTGAGRQDKAEGRAGWGQGRIGKGAGTGRISLGQDGNRQEGDKQDRDRGADWNGDKEDGDQPHTALPSQRGGSGAPPTPFPPKGGASPPLFPRLLSAAAAGCGRRGCGHG